MQNDFRFLSSFSRFQSHCSEFCEFPDTLQLTERILTDFQLQSYQDVLVRDLSGGNCRKLTVAVTCLGSSRVVLMDEPTSDMDPLTRSMVYRTIDQLLLQQRAVVLTCHSFSEIQDISQRVGILQQGRLSANTTPAELSAQYEGFYSVSLFVSDSNRLEFFEKVNKALAKVIQLLHF